MTFIRIAIGFIGAALAATVFGSIVQTQLVIAASGIDVSTAVRLGMTTSDLMGLAPSYGPVIAVGLAIAFAVAAILKRIIKPLASIAYPLAGAAAIATALIVMPIWLDLPGMTPLAGTRGGLGFALQGLAGALGGLVFSLVAVRRRR